MRNVLRHERRRLHHSNAGAKSDGNGAVVVFVELREGAVFVAGVERERRHSLK